MKTTRQATKKKAQNPAIELLTEATWNFSHSVLWNGHPFSESTITLSKKFIREYFENIPEEKFSLAPKFFSRYCERVLLAKAYVNRYSHRYIPHPCIWLNRKNPKGFAGTKAWLERIIAKRKLENALLQSEFYRESLLLNAKGMNQFSA
jgi:hypothetical protein